MTRLETATVVGVVVLAILIWVYFRLRGKDRVEEMIVQLIEMMKPIEDVIQIIGRDPP